MLISSFDKTEIEKYADTKIMDDNMIIKIVFLFSMLIPLLGIIDILLYHICFFYSTLSTFFLNFKFFTKQKIPKKKRK